MSFPEPTREPLGDAGAAGATIDDDESAPRACSADESCGVTADGAPMVCFKASMLAGHDFCAEACDPGQAADDDHVCSFQGALLERCHPSTFSDPAADCSRGLHCYRTNLLADEGVCIDMPVCSTSADCNDTQHETCGADLIGRISQSTAGLRLDHLNCVHALCNAVRSGCETSEGCLATQYGPQAADLCTPWCDSNLRCPPNYSCLRATSGPGSPNLCMPALPGFRCEGQPCLIGKCEDSGAGFNICTIACDTDADCQPLNTNTDPFYCVEGGAHRHCVTPRPFHGANCASSQANQCDAARKEICSAWDPNGLHGTRGECRVPCNADGRCEPRGGLNFACLQDGEGGCFPGQLGLPCRDQTDCISKLECLDVQADPELATPRARYCSRRCGQTGADADAECDAIYRDNGGGYCAGGYCRPLRRSGSTCTRSGQCISMVCGSEGTCVEATTPTLQ